MCKSKWNTSPEQPHGYDVVGYRSKGLACSKRFTKVPVVDYLIQVFLHTDLQTELYQ